MHKPNIIFVFSDQHRAQDIGYAGNDDVKTPNFDQMSHECISFQTAVSCCPVCSPYRASLLTGQYPNRHGVFVNDVSLYEKMEKDTVAIGEAFCQAGYNTAYIGKWHVDGHGRKSYIPKERRMGFEYWKVLECTHDYNDSNYYGDDNLKLKWEGYDAKAQTLDAQQYLINREKDKPFALFLSWGPPHNPFQTAPEKFKKMYNKKNIKLRPNVPKDMADKAREDLAGYYSHISALDSLFGDLLATIKKEGLKNDTIVVYTSDHGEMLYSHDEIRKQKPWDESILVPFLLRYPKMFGNDERKINTPINSPDIMPTLLGLCDIPIPKSVEGFDYKAVLKGETELIIKAALIESIHPFGEYNKTNGGKAYRGIRTERYTYVRDLKGPWLLYDNLEDPYQLNNLCNKKEFADLQKELEQILQKKLDERNDLFLTGDDYIKQWGYIVDETGTVPYKD